MKKHPALFRSLPLALLFAAAAAIAGPTAGHRPKAPTPEFGPRANCLVNAVEVLVKGASDDSGLVAMGAETQGKSGYVFVDRSRKPKVPTPPEVLKIAERAKKVRGLEDHYRELQLKPEWVNPEGNFDRYSGFKPSNAKALEGRQVIGFLEDGNEFAGRVVYVFQDAKRPGTYRAIVADAEGNRSAVDITGARGLLIHEGDGKASPPSSGKKGFKGTQTMSTDSSAVALEKADKLPWHWAEQGKIQVTRTPDGTILVPGGYWNINGEGVTVQPSAYKPPPAGMAEPIGLAAAEADGFRIVGPLGEGGTRRVYLAEKNGVKYAVKILDPDKLYPPEASDYVGAENHNWDWRFNPNRTPELEARWKAFADELAAKLANRELGMADDIGRRGFNPLKPKGTPRMSVNGVVAFELFGESSLGEAIRKYPELANDPEVLKRTEALGKYDLPYNVNVNLSYYGIGLGYRNAEGTAVPLGIDMKPHGLEPWDNTRVNIEIVPERTVDGKVIKAHARIKEAKDVDW